MKALAKASLAGLATILLATTAFADSVSNIYTCKLEDGKSLDDAHAANSDWLKFVNENGGGGKVTSSTASAIVGDSDEFYFVDNYPDLKTWAAVQEALRDAEDMEDMFDDIMECDKNRLYAIRSTE